MIRIKVPAIMTAVLVMCGAAFAQNGKIVPIVDMKLKGLLGGSSGGKWIKAKETAESITPQTKFRLISEDSVDTGKAVSGSLVAPEVPCEEYYGMELDAASGIAVGDGINWKLFPRAPLKLFAGNATYLKIVRTFLVRQGLAKSAAKIKSAYKIDLDGDKTDEVVIAGTYYKNGMGPSATAGDYSFVIVRKIVSKTVVDIVLEGDFIKKNVEFGAPNEYDISAIADLNGDGKMEIVVYGAYYEGAFSSVFEIDGEKPVKVLETGCGV